MLPGETGILVTAVLEAVSNAAGVQLLDVR